MSGKGTFSLKEMRLPIPTTLFIYISTIFYRNDVPNILCSLFSCMSNRPLGLSMKYYGEHGNDLHFGGLNCARLLSSLNTFLT